VGGQDAIPLVPRVTSTPFDGRSTMSTRSRPSIRNLWPSTTSRLQRSPATLNHTRDNLARVIADGSAAERKTTVEKLTAYGKAQPTTAGAGPLSATTVTWGLGAPPGNTVDPTGLEPRWAGGNIMRTNRQRSSVTPRPLRLFRSSR
jgi:hypothetical protein